MRREPSLPAAIFIAVWLLADVWLIYAVSWHIVARLA